MARYNHDDNMLLGTTAARTLRLTVDEVGLVYEVDVPQARADVFELIQRGDVNKSSFAFIALEDDWALNDLDIPLRSVLGDEADRRGAGQRPRLPGHLDGGPVAGREDARRPG